MTCETCKHWTRLPDKVYQAHFEQKPVGEPKVTRYGICSKVSHQWLVPHEDGIATNEANASEPSDTLTTGINFGCIHFKP